MPILCCLLLMPLPVTSIEFGASCQVQSTICHSESRRIYSARVVPASNVRIVGSYVGSADPEVHSKGPVLGESGCKYPRPGEVER